MCIEGPVGSGKSAFLNAINGNLIRTSGSVHVEDVEAGKKKSSSKCVKAQYECKGFYC